MTKQHFISLADYIKYVYKGASERKLFTPDHLDVLASFCKYQNANFNRERWLSYIAGECGPNGGTIKPPRKPRYVTPERKLARRLEGQ